MVVQTQRAWRRPRGWTNTTVWAVCVQVATGAAAQEAITSGKGLGQPSAQGLIDVPCGEGEDEGLEAGAAGRGGGQDKKERTKPSKLPIKAKGN